MERRVLLALFLSFLVFYIYQALVPQPTPPEAAKTGQAAVGKTAATGAPQGTPSGNAAAGAAAPSPAAAPRQPTPAPAVPTAETLVGATAEQKIRVETSRVVAVFTNRGARLESWQLKGYRNQESGAPLELVSNELQATHPLPFSLRVPDEQTTSTLNGALYSVTENSHPEGQAAVVSFEYRNSDGLAVKKTFRILPDAYRVSFQATVEKDGQALVPAIEWGPGPDDAGSQTSRFHIKPEGIVFADDSASRFSASAVAKQASHDGTYRFAGIEDHYFMAVALDPGPSTIVYQPVSVPPPAGSKESARDLMGFTLQPKQMAQPLVFFVGPKEFDVLSGLDPKFVKAINYGMFSVIVVPLLRSLVWINGFIGNFGWSIIILTLMINGLMFPLRHKSVVSMRKMQEIQPEVKAIQERYSKLKATDPGKQKMNQEMMDLYRQRGVNPASGCLPMLLTMPVLYAFYSLLNYSIQLRGAPFVFWIHDLSLPDPYYVTPVLMGISQLWQQRLQPAAGADPAQQKMMMLMPIVFTVLFLWAPAGVAIYWAVSNAWGIGQTYLTNYLIGPPKVHNVRPAAERRLKRAGGGKSEAAARES
jgi:YidC/Oxa1 family membrane protein insertase